MDLNNCADISEMIYLAKHPEEEEVIKFDVSFLLNLVLTDEDWIKSLGVVE